MYRCLQHCVSAPSRAISCCEHYVKTVSVYSSVNGWFHYQSENLIWLGGEETHRKVTPNLADFRVGVQEIHSLASQPLFFFFFFLVKGEEKKKASGDFSQVSVGRWNAIT